MSADNQHRSGSFESYAAFDTDNRVTYVHITADAVSCANLFHFLDSLDRVVKLLVVDSLQFAFLESQTELLASFFLNVFQVSRFRQSLCGIKNLTATNGSTPKAYVIRVFQFGEVCAETMLVQIVYFLLAAQCHITG